MNETIDLSKLSEEDLQSLLDKKRSNKKKKLEKEKIEYEESRDLMMADLISKAVYLESGLRELKQQCHDSLSHQEVKLQEYGLVRSNSKGGFTLKNKKDTFSITRRRDTKPSWDERSVKAIGLLKEFLTDAVKKRDVKLYEILMSFLEKNQNGDLEYARVMDLIKHEDKFDDERWHEGLRLIKQSYSNNLRAYGYEFKYKGENGEIERIQLNFSSI